MPKFTNKRHVNHTAEQMFDLVADVERYPEFVPMCQSLKVRQRMPGPNGTETIVCDMTVSFKLIREKFTSRVTLDRPNLRIGWITCADRSPAWKIAGPSRRRGAAASEVTFFIAYEFRSRMLAMLMGAMFDAAFQRFAGAFEKRADVIYPRPAPAA